MASVFNQQEMEEYIRNQITHRMQAPESIGAMLDFEFESCDAEAGTAVVSHVINEREVNIYNTLHGGIITWLMDSGMGMLTRAYTGYDTLVTLDIHTHLLRPIYAGEKVYITARVTHPGSKIVNTTSELYVNDKLCATADAIFYRIDG